MIAYALRAAYQEDFLGGVLTVSGDGTSFNVLEELEKGDGTILVEDTDYFLITKLDEYAPLKRVSVPNKDKDDAPAATFDSLADLSMRDLRAQAESLQIEKPGRFNKDELVAAIRAAQNPTTED